MRRRDFITAVGRRRAWPLAVRAQQRALPVVGYLHFYHRDEYFLTAFRSGLAQTGYVEGRNVAIEYRFANNDTNRLREFAADLIAVAGWASSWRRSAFSGYSRQP